MEREALKLAIDGLERILGSFEQDGKFVMKSMIRNELFAKINLLLKKAKKVLAQPVQREWVSLTDEETQAYWDWEDWQTGAGRSTIFEMVRDIEAKLRSKNNG